MKLIDKTFLKFILVGILNTLVGSGVMFLLYNLFNASYWISSSCNYIIGGIVSYILNKYFTFNNKQKSIKQIILYIINLVLCYFISYYCAKKLFLFLLSSKSQKIQENISLFCGMCLYTLLNYFGQRFIVFRYNKYDESIQKNNKLNEK